MPEQLSEHLNTDDIKRMQIDYHAKFPMKERDLPTLLAFVYERGRDDQREEK